MQRKLKVGLLSTPDSTTTQALIRELNAEGVQIDFMVHWKPDFQQNWKRLRFMLKKQGLLAVIEAVFKGVLAGAIKKISTSTGSKVREYSVSHHNSLQTQEILRVEKPDILLLSTNSIIKKNIFSLARLVTLNAHPAWLPAFRGMGSSHYQLKAGFHLAVTVHGVDEGIDSGPIYAREVVELDLRGGVPELRRQLFGIQPDIHRVMARLFRQVIDAFQEERALPMDCSYEKNELFKGGMPKSEMAELDRLLRTPAFALRRPDRSMDLLQKTENEK